MPVCGMDRATREHLRIIIGVALALVPPRIRQAFAQKPTGISEPAKDAMAERITAAVDQLFEVKQKPDPGASVAISQRRPQEPAQ